MAAKLLPVSVEAVPLMVQTWSSSTMSPSPSSIPDVAHVKVSVVKGSSGDNTTVAMLGGAFKMVIGSLSAPSPSSRPSLPPCSLA